MKATGIVRRIDDLGRVVIPKEINDDSLIVTFLEETFTPAPGGLILEKRQLIIFNSPGKLPVTPPPIFEASGFQSFGNSPPTNSESFTNPVRVRF